MSLELYTDLAITALELLDEFGQTVIVHHGSALSNNLIEGSRTGTRATTSHRAVVATNSGKLMSDVRMVGNASIMTTDIKVVFGNDVELDDDDKIEVAGYVWSILKIIRIAPGDQLISTTAWLRR